MKILKLTAYSFPEQISSSYLGKDLIDELVRNDINIKVIVPTPCRGIDEETRKKYSSVKDEYLYGGKVHIHRFRLFREKKNTFQRFIRYIICNIKQYRLGKSEKDVDVIYTNSTPPTVGIFCAKLKKKLSAKYKREVPFIYNLQDIFPDSLVNVGLTHKGSLIWKIGRKIEDYTYKNADKIIVIGEDFKKNLLEKNVPEEKIVVIPNWVDESNIKCINRENNTLFDEYGIDRYKFYFAYSGNVGLTQNFDMLLEVADELKENKKIGFIIVGGGAYAETVRKTVGEKALENVVLIPHQPYSRISEVLSLGDVALVISKKGIGSNSVPSKTWNYMMAEKPILASFDIDSELCRVVQENGCGICVDAENKEEFKKAILKMSVTDCSAFGANSKQYIKNNLSKEKMLNKYVIMFEEQNRSKETQEKEIQYV